jgi:hypothetical protein
MEATNDYFLRAIRTAPLTRDEMAILARILTQREFEAVLRTQTDKQRAAAGRRLMRDLQLH